MFKFLFKKENLVESLIYKYLENFQLTQENFTKAISSCLDNHINEEFNFLFNQTHKYESKADDIIDEVNNLMYGKALIPESRGDIMNLLHSLDKIPHYFESVLFIIKYQELTIPEDIVMDIQALLKISIESCELLSKQVTLFLKKETGIRSLMSIIDTNESHCDHIEQRIISKIFKSDIDPFLKLQIKELIIKMGDISDQADRVSKIINIISMKRRV